MTRPAISVLRVAARSRAAGGVMVAAVAMWAVAAAIGRRSLEIDLSAVNPPTKMPVVEAIACLGATVVAILTRPRFWEFDRVAICPSRPRAVAGASAVIGIVVPALCVPAVVPWLPTGSSWSWVAANAVIVSAAVQLIAPLLSPLTAGAITLVGWLGSGLVMNLAPQVWVPLSDYRDPVGSWGLAVVLGAAAVALHVSTCGRTGWAHHRFAMDQ